LEVPVGFVRPHVAMCSICLGTFFGGTPLFWTLEGAQDAQNIGLPFRLHEAGANTALVWLSRKCGKKKEEDKEGFWLGQKSR
jgi:hypothetical protein